MTIDEQLAAARAARHQLLTGTQMVEVDYGTYKARYTPANREALEAYIRELESELARKPVRGAIGIVF